MHISLNQRVIIIGAIVLGIAFFWKYSSASHQGLAGKTITLSITDTAIPSMDSPYRTVNQNTDYVFQREGNEDHLYFRANGISQEVVGDLPVKQKMEPWCRPGCDFGWFVDVTTLTGKVTYVTYTRIRGEGPAEANDLYVLQGNKIKKILSHLRVAGINGLDTRIPIEGYLDRRGNFYVLTQNQILYIIRDGQMVGNADVSNIGAKFPAMPAMFSDDQNTYFLIPKLFENKDSLSGYSSFSGNIESEIEAKYKIDF